MEEPALRKLLKDTKPSGDRLPEPARFRIDAVPARVIAQRPDIAAVERQLAAASAEIGGAEADRYPRLTLAGNITRTRIAVGSSPALLLSPWSIGPSVSLPFFDGGRRKANVEAARAQYASVESAYRSKVRNAVREVEEALVRLESAAARETEARAASASYRANLVATTEMQRVGLGSALDVEESRRLSLAAESNLSSIAQERVAAWIALYRAVGGGWAGAGDNAFSVNNFPNKQTP
jgi:outer membrane protein TolC